MTRATVDGDEAVGIESPTGLTVCCIYDHAVVADGQTSRTSGPARSGPNLLSSMPSVVDADDAGRGRGAFAVRSRAALATTFTTSQGLLLMIPNMSSPVSYNSTCCASRPGRWPPGLSIFGDHSDVIAVPSRTEFAARIRFIAQDHDLALVAQAAALSDRCDRALLRPVHLARAGHDRATFRRRPARAHAGDWSAHRSQGALAGAAVHPGHRTTPTSTSSAETVKPFYAAVPAPVRTRWTASPPVPATSITVEYTSTTPKPTR